MQKIKSERNKTIDFLPKENPEFLERCISAKDRETPFLLEEIRNNIIFGDLFTVAPLLPHSFVDLLIADPPYNIDKTFGETTFHQMTADNYEKYTENWISLVKPLLKPCASLYICCDWKSSSAIERVLVRHFTVQNRITWQREKGRGSKSNWKNAMEDIWFATNSSKNFTFNVESVKMRRRVIAPYRNDGNPKDWEETKDGNFRNTCPSNFWDDISIPYWSMAENTAHPTQKPEKLLAKLILASSNKGEMVFDPFLGSGSSAVTAKKLCRTFCGIEKNKQYCAWAQKRLEMANDDKTIQGYADGVFWERNTSSRLLANHKK